MLQSLIQRLKEKSTIKKWQSTDAAKAINEHIKTTFSEIPIFQEFSVEGRENLTVELHQKAFEIVNSDKPILSLRKELSDFVFLFSNYQVLCLTEEEKANQFYSECPYISGALHPHAGNCEGFIEELDEFLWKNKDLPNREILAFCNARCAVLLFFINGLNLIRVTLADVDEQKDWLQPFVKAMLIWSEDIARDKLEKPSLLPVHGGLKFSTFFNFVENGYPNPYFEWEKQWSDDPISLDG